MFWNLMKDSDINSKYMIFKIWKLRKRKDDNFFALHVST